MRLTDMPSACQKCWKPGTVKQVLSGVWICRGCELELERWRSFLKENSFSLQDELGPQWPKAGEKPPQTSDAKAPGRPRA